MPPEDQLSLTEKVDLRNRYGWLQQRSLGIIVFTLCSTFIHSLFRLCLQVGAVVVGFDSRANYCKVRQGPPSTLLKSLQLEDIRSGILMGLWQRI